MKPVIILCDDRYNEKQFPINLEPYINPSMRWLRGVPTPGSTP